jgi:hypothetical protein
VGIDDPVRARWVLAERFGIDVAEANGSATLVFPLAGCDPADINRALVEAGLKVHQLTYREETLEDIFIKLTGTTGEVRG